MRTVGAGVFFVLLARVFAHEAMYRFAMGVLMLGWRIFSQSPASFLTHVRNLWSEAQWIIVTAYIPLPFLATDIVRSGQVFRPTADGIGPCFVVTMEAPPVFFSILLDVGFLRRCSCELFTWPWDSRRLPRWRPLSPLIFPGT